MNKHNVKKGQNLKPKKYRLCRAETAAWRNGIICTATVSVRVCAGKQQTEQETGGVFAPCSISLREACEIRTEGIGEGGAGLSSQYKASRQDSLCVEQGCTGFEF